HGGEYGFNIYNFYLTRYPDQKINFYNCGVGGDTASGALRRLNEDLFSHKPNQITIMFGMNDVGIGLYNANPTEKDIAAQQSRIVAYKKNFDILFKKLLAECPAKITIITPSIYDDTGINDKNNNHVNANSGLAACSEFLKTYAAQNNAALVEFNAPMYKYNVQQKLDPKFTIVGPDRVHPRSPGHLMMAWLFLKAQGVSPTVSNVVIDAKAKQVCKCENAICSELTIDGKTVSFTLLEKSLPLPIDQACSKLIQTLPIVEDLNQEIVQIANLPGGNYTLCIDAITVGQFSSSELGKGINLSMNPKAPQYKQSQEVFKLSSKRHMAELILREFACVRWYLQLFRINIDDLAGVKTFYETKMPDGYFKTLMPRYLERWDKRAEYVSDFEKWDRETRKAAKPIAHQYKLTPAQ
ncbi:MAG: SGNH/GDSL hydrolase family protein, partial [Planctomycetia bacterium]|nr:SGNH/GDSL hydrolase family protein [Planctomycetia bacterium]